MMNVPGSAAAPPPVVKPPTKLEEIEALIAHKRAGRNIDDSLTRLYTAHALERIAAQLEKLVEHVVSGPKSEESEEKKP